MLAENKERWEQLCALVATEEDTERLAKLIEEINRMLEEKLSRLNRIKPIKPPHTELTL